MLDRLTGSPDRKAAVPMKRGATPEEIAEAIFFVASDKASYITAQILRVNGGKTASYFTRDVSMAEEQASHDDHTQ